MSLRDVVSRTPVPEPWAEGEKIPWNDPDFSRRMLREHLSQAHDAASRRTELIEGQVAWIQANLLPANGRVLDLGCGPGLYTSRLAERGHECVGIDFGPASIAYAREQASARNLPCTYHLADMRAAEFGTGYDLAMLIFGEFNVFRPADAALILRKIRAALKPEGYLLLEISTLDSMRARGNAAPAWYSSESGLFSDGPHVCLEERFWDADLAVTTERYLVIDAITSQVMRYTFSTQTYTVEALTNFLTETSFDRITFHDQFGAEHFGPQSYLQAVTARPCVSEFGPMALS